MRALVYGLAIAGASTVRALQRRGHHVVVADDHIEIEPAPSDDASTEAGATASEIPRRDDGCQSVHPLSDQDILDKIDET